MRIPLLLLIVATGLVGLRVAATQQSVAADAPAASASAPQGLQPEVTVLGRRQLRGMSLSQFADYAAMVGLAEIRPTPHLQDRQSILRLFGRDPPAAPTGMDDWDRLFLKYLYTTDGALKAQRSAIGWNMVRELVR